MEATAENIQKAKAFVLQKWKERAAERGLPEPANLENACKFASMFAQRIFGGQIQGNWHHQYVVKDGQIIDLTDGKHRYHDKTFWNNPGHKASMESCRHRVEKWVREFLSENRTDTNWYREASKRLGKEWVFHNIWSADIPAVEKEGLQGGSFSQAPGFDFGKDAWIAVRLSDLRNPKNHQYGSITAIEPQWGPGYGKNDGFHVIPADRVALVDRRGRLIRMLQDKRNQD